MPSMKDCQRPDCLGSVPIDTSPTVYVFPASCARPARGAARRLPATAAIKKRRDRSGGGSGSRGALLMARPRVYQRRRAWRAAATRVVQWPPMPDAVPTKPKRRVLDRIDDEEIVRLASDLIRIPSFTTEETPCAEWLAGYLDGQGLAGAPQGVEPGGQQNNQRPAGPGGGRA